MKRYTKMEYIADLIKNLNAKRKRQHKQPVERCWTGVGHWLREPLKNNRYRSVGSIYVSINKFIGFLEGLLYESPKE